MRSKSTTLVIFLAGVVVGVSMAWHRAKSTYETLLEEELEAVKRTYDDRAATNKELENERTNGADSNAYVDVVYAEEYASSTDSPRKDSVVRCDPYVIPPDEFGNLDDFEEVTLLYFTDGVLTDEDLNRISDVEATVGSKALNDFGRFEPYCVYVRNERLLNDYEILLDLRSYSVAISDKPTIEADG